MNDSGNEPIEERIEMVESINEKPSRTDRGVISVIQSTGSNININSPQLTPTVPPPTAQSRLVISPSHQEWDEQVEGFVRSFLADSEKAKEDHHTKGEWCQTLRNMWGLPSIMIPLIMAPLTQTFRDNPATSYISMGAFMISGITSSISQYFNYGKKSEQHFNTEADYSDLITDIKEELAKSRDNRREAAVSMSAFKMRFDCISKDAPCY